MPETNTSTRQPSSLTINAAGNYYERWRLLKDKIARYGVVLGGLSVIVAVVLIFFYLLYVVFPLFLNASATSVNQYDLPDAATQGKTVLLEIEEQNEMAVRFTDNGQISFFEVATGKPVLQQSIAIPAGAQITSFAQGSPASDGTVVYGLSDGRAVLVKYHYTVTYPDNKRLITPSIKYPLGEEPVVVDNNGAALEKIAVKSSEKSTTIVAKTANGTEGSSQIRLLNLVKEQSLLADEATVNRTESVLNVPVQGISRFLIDKDESSLYVLTNEGQLGFYDLGDKSAPVLKQEQSVVGAGHKVTSMAFLNGDLSLLIGDSQGHVAQWGKVRDGMNKLAMTKIREFKVSDKAIVAVNAEQRRKGFVAVDADGVAGIYHSTSERELIKEKMADEPVLAVLSPRANNLLLQNASGKINLWHVDNEHPEVSLRSLWQKVWYESYPKPDYIWQSSSASNDFEPKYSLTPLVFGTLKAAFYAMLVALPLALMGAIYTAYFMAPEMRQIVKPTIELMGALPTVILGFLAGLWLAPFVEKHLAGLFAFLLIAPLGVMVFAYAWQYLPKTIRQKIPEGWDAAILIPVITFLCWFAFAMGAPLEELLFGGSLQDWFKNTLGIGYDQRNALIVGIAMGFAVVPTIFSIAEDAIFSVPKHLTVGSLALGATPWQTMTKVVLLTASPGIFSAIMIGLGRGIGETMIVLMATGNTPVMDISIFQGLRTLAANIAVEMPESEVDGTHYRVLFLAALVLFLFTFIFNTLAEVIRQRLREKYSSL